ncbi:MAG: ABC transporter ATP-binding protein [Patescibacteria group bacterium]|jgi:ATP-binding cassette subfamily B protein
MKDNTKKTFKIFWQYSLKHKISGLIMVTSVIVASSLDIVVPLYFKQFFNTLASGSPSELLAKSLVLILLSIATLEFIQWIFWRFATFSDSYFTAKIAADISNYCFAYLHQHSFAYFNNNFVGSLVKRVKWFVKAFETIADRVVWSLLPLMVNILVIALVLFKVNIWLSLGVVIWVVAFLAINWVFTKYKLKYDIARSEAETATTRVLADTITNNVNVKLFNGYWREIKGFAKVTEELRQKRMFTWTLGNIIEAVQGFLMVGLEIGIFYLAIKLWVRGILTIGDFVLIQSYLVTIFMRTWEFGRVIRIIYENLADAEEMTVILNLPHEIKDIPNAKKLVVKTGKIEFENVIFNYHETRRILNNFNLTVKAGERLALIGPSGAGKTTVIKLLLRMYDVTGGRILIDGQDVSKVTQESLWQNVSLVPQDPILFHRTLMENIRYGKPKASNQEVIKAAQAAHCHEFIRSFSEGYETYVGERGVKLSGGERQRVAIARAILRNAPILVLDEATSSLDSESEYFIQDALDKLMKGKTVIVIAHRLSTIRKMDRIIVISEKGIIEDGTHEELLKKDSGLYKKLWHLQAGGFLKY